MVDYCTYSRKVMIPDVRGEHSRSKKTEAMESMGGKATVRALVDPAPKGEIKKPAPPRTPCATLKTEVPALCQRILVHIINLPKGFQL